MNYHKKALQIIQKAQSSKELFTLLMEIAIKRPSEIIEAWDRLHPKAKPVKPPALIKGAPSFVDISRNKQVWYDCPNCFSSVRFVDVNGRCVHCRVDEVETSNLTEG